MLRKGKREKISHYKSSGSSLPVSPETVIFSSGNSLPVSPETDIFYSVYLISELLSFFTSFAIATVKLYKTLVVQGLQLLVFDKSREKAWR